MTKQRRKHAMTKAKVPEISATLALHAKQYLDLDLEQDRGRLCQDVEAAVREHGTKLKQFIETAVAKVRGG